MRPTQARAGASSPDEAESETEDTSDSSLSSSEPPRSSKESARAGAGDRGAPRPQHEATPAALSTIEWPAPAATATTRSSCSTVTSAGRRARVLRRGGERRAPAVRRRGAASSTSTRYAALPRSLGGASAPARPAAPRAGGVGPQVGVASAGRPSAPRRALRRGDAGSGGGDGGAAAARGGGDAGGEAPRSKAARASMRSGVGESSAPDPPASHRSRAGVARPQRPSSARPQAKAAPRPSTKTACRAEKAAKILPLRCSAASRASRNRRSSSGVSSGAGAPVARATRRWARPSRATSVVHAISGSATPWRRRASWAEAPRAAARARMDEAPSCARLAASAAAATSAATPDAFSRTWKHAGSPAGAGSSATLAERLWSSVTLAERLRVRLPGPSAGPSFERRPPGAACAACLRARRRWRRRRSSLLLSAILSFFFGRVC